MTIGTYHHTICEISFIVHFNMIIFTLAKQLFTSLSFPVRYFICLIMKLYQTFLIYLAKSTRHLALSADFTTTQTPFEKSSHDRHMRVIKNIDINKKSNKRS